MGIKYTYKGTETDTESNSILLTTSGKYLEDDIEIEAEGGGNANILNEGADGWDGDKLDLTQTFEKYGTYGFTYNSTDGLKNENWHVKSSYAMCKIPFTVVNACDITVAMFQSSEKNYDFGFLSNLDTMLAQNTNSTDANCVNLGGGTSGAKGKEGAFSYTFTNVSVGDHYITIKYRKDSSSDGGTDTFAVTEIKASVAQGIKVKEWVDTGEDIDIVRWADESIPIPTEVINITENGTHDVTNKATAIVNVSGPGPSPGSGYSITLMRNGHENDSDIHFKINGVDNKIDVTEDSASFYKYPPMAGIETIAVSADHFATSAFAAASSWFRIKPVGGSTWHNLSKNEVYTLTGDSVLQFGYGSCLLKGTLIKMADGSYLPIELVRKDMYIMGYDGKPRLVYKSQYGERNYNSNYAVWTVLTPNGEKEIRTTYKHEFYNVEKGRMCYLVHEDEDVSNRFALGDHLLDEDGNECELISCDVVNKPCEHYSLWCENNIYYANGFVCGNRHSIQINYERG